MKPEEICKNENRDLGQISSSDLLNQEDLKDSDMPRSSSISSVLASLVILLLNLISDFSFKIQRMMAVIKRIRHKQSELIQKNRKLEEEMEDYKEKIRELTERLNKDSTNSSKPPSSDGYKKKKKSRSLRHKGERQPGGQFGHKGHHMEMPPGEHKDCDHLPEKCKNCKFLENCKKSGVLKQKNETRHVVDIKMDVEIKDHHVYERNGCPQGFCDTETDFPKDVRGYIQYGSSFSVLAGLLNNYAAVGYDKMSVLIGNLTGTSISPGTLNSMVKRTAALVRGVVEKDIKFGLIESELIHADETMIRINGENYWVHSACNQDYVHLSVSKHRGREGMDEAGILPNFKSDGTIRTIVTDCFSPYFKLVEENHLQHGLCNSHGLRDMIGVEQNYPDLGWPVVFKMFLLHIKNLRDKAIQEGKTCFSPEEIACISKGYDTILNWALENETKIENDPQTQSDTDKPPSRKRKKRKKHTSAENLLIRLIKRKDRILLFAYDFNTPFDNNIAERSLRNLKVKVKVIGCFRSEEGAGNYVTITSYLSTARQNGITAFKALTEAYNGHPEIIFANEIC